MRMVVFGTEPWMLGFVSKQRNRPLYSEHHNAVRLYKPRAHVCHVGLRGGSPPRQHRLDGQHGVVVAPHGVLGARVFMCL